jgi:hypothetical protein
VGHILYPQSFYETDNGYKLFGVADSSFFVGLSNYILPAIINTDKNGDTINTEYPYSIYAPDNYANFGCLVDPINNTGALSVNKNFYNAYISSSIPIGDHLFEYHDHLLICAYDSSGKYLWRRGYDTMPGSIDRYQLISLKHTPRNTILALLQVANRTSDTYIFNIKLIETDIEGNILKNILYSIDSQSVEAIDAAELEDGTIYILGQYININENKNFLIKYNSNGEIVKTLDIPKSSIYNHVKGISISPAGDILLYGNSTIDKKDPTNFADDIFKLYLAKISKNMEFEWEYLWYENDFYHQSKLMNVIFLDDNNLLAVGYKDIINIFCSKISLIPTDVKEYTNKNDRISISPNPAGDYIEISSINPTLKRGVDEGSVIQIFDMLGVNVSTPDCFTVTPASGGQRIEISFLSPGVYFIKIGNKVDKFVKI